MPRQLPVPIQRSEYDRLLPVEKMHYDMLTNKEGYDFDQSKTTVRVSPQFFVTVPDPPKGYDPAQGKGGGKFHAPAEGKIVHQKREIDPQMYSRLEAQINAKVAAGELTEDEGREQRSDLVNDDRAYRTITKREYAPRIVSFRNAAELKQELERRRVQGEFSRGEDGLFGLVPFDIYQQKEATARVEAEIDKLGPGAARGLGDDVRNPEQIKDSDPVGDALPEPEQVKEREEVPDKPVKESKDAAKDVVKTDALRKEKRAREIEAILGDVSGDLMEDTRAALKNELATLKPPPPPSEPGTGLPPRSGKTEAETPSDAPREPITPRSVPASEVEPSDPTDPALPKRERKDPEKEPSPPEDEPASDEELKKIQRELDEKDVFDQLQQALQPVEEEEPRAELIAAATGAPQRGALSARDPEALPEPTDDPDLLVELAEGPEDPPMVEAEAVDELPVTQPPTLPEEPVDVDVELEQEDTPSAEEIKSFAADTIGEPGGMEYLRGAFVEFARYAYDPSSPLDRRRMDFLAKFLRDAQFPQGDERALVARKAFDRMKAQSVEQMKEG